MQFIQHARVSALRIRQVTQLNYIVDIVICGPDAHSLGEYSRLDAFGVVTPEYMPRTLCAYIFTNCSIGSTFTSSPRDNSRDSIGRLGKLAKSGCYWLYTYARLSNVGRAWIHIFAQCCIFMRQQAIRLWPIFSLHIRLH